MPVGMQRRPATQGREAPAPDFVDGDVRESSAAQRVLQRSVAGTRIWLKLKGQAKVKFGTSFSSGIDLTLSRAACPSSRAGSRLRDGPSRSASLQPSDRASAAENALHTAEATLRRERRASAAAVQADDHALEDLNTFLVASRT
jgi:hypothetical protein